MFERHENAVVRRVVSGVNDEGRSMVARDERVPSRVVTEAFTINQIWQTESLPPRIDADDTSNCTVSITPPPAGFVYLVTTFPPDSSWNPAAGYQQALSASGGAQAYVEDDEIAGLHETDTVDIITVLSGELYAVLEEDEVLLRPGESFVQRGTRHSWSNRSDKPATIVAVMMSATRG